MDIPGFAAAVSALLLVLSGCGVADPEPDPQSAAEAERQMAEAMGYDSVEEYREGEAARTAANEAAGSDREHGPLIGQIEAAWADSYGSKAEWAIEEFTADNGQSNVTVVAALADKPENSESARGICLAVASLAGDRITADWRRVYVTAGERGRFLAECEPVRR